MKKLLFFTLIASVALVSSCLDRTEVQTAETDDLTLELVFGAPQTRADGDINPEDQINSVDFFFYTDTAAAPVFSYRDAAPVITTDGKYKVTLTAGGTLGETQVPDLDVLFNNKKTYFFAVFNSPSAITGAKLADMKKLAVANSFSYDAREEGAKDPVWIVTPDSDPLGHKKDFVMTGEKELTRSGNQKVTGTVDMTRLAAKVAVTLQIDQRVNISKTSTPDYWCPLIGRNNVRLYLCNYVQNSVIGAADATPLYPSSFTQADYTPYIVNTDNPATGEGKYVILPQQDYYTYPIEWTPGADSEPFIKLVLPWYPESGAAPSKELYYKIMFPKNITKLEANKYYQFTVNVTLQGNEGEPTIELEAEDAQVVGWGNSDKVNPVISAAKYLSVQKESVVFYTVSSGSGFSSSDPASLEIVNVYHKDLKTGNTEYIVRDGVLQTNVRTDLGTKSWITSGSGANALRVGLRVGNNNWILLDNEHSYIQAGHPLDKSLTSIYMDVTPWTYEVKVHLGPADNISGSTYNDNSYIRSITFEQWPEVYVVADPNSNNGANVNTGIFINGNNTQTTTWQVGTDEEWNTSDQRETVNLGGANGFLGNPGNKNPNMYVLTISVSDTYTIGDPRTDEVSMPDFHWRYQFRERTGGIIIPQYRYWYGDWTDNWAPGHWTENGSITDHVLTYYHPAAANSTTKETSEMIAPKIRVASSYGVCTTGRTREEAILRCATYQEDGIPAGRWRLPTYAEVEFIANLSSLGRIPYLFGQSSNNGQTPTNSNTHYWTANGLIEINNGSTSGQNRHVTRLPNATDATYDNESVRCVYDEWFWGDATTSRPVADKTQFTWGDRNY